MTLCLLNCLGLHRLLQLLPLSCRPRRCPAARRRRRRRHPCRAFIHAVRSSSARLGRADVDGIVAQWRRSPVLRRHAQVMCWQWWGRRPHCGAFARHPPLSHHGQPSRQGPVLPGRSPGRRPPGGAPLCHPAAAGAVLCGLQGRWCPRAGKREPVAPHGRAPAVPPGQPQEPTMRVLPLLCRASMAC